MVLPGGGVILAGELILSADFDGVLNSGKHSPWNQQRKETINTQKTSYNQTPYGKNFS